MDQTRTATVIAVGNQKGGVAKTTTVVHLAAALGQAGRRCLIIDLDPAAGATKHLGVPTDRFAGTFEMLIEGTHPAELALDDGLPAGVHLIPARTQLAALDARLNRYIDRTRLLERPLARARPLYDYVLLDTMPAAGETTTVAAYCAADWFLLTALPHPLALAGIDEALRDIADVRAHRNPRLEVLGVLLACVDVRTRLLDEVRAEIARSLPGRGFSAEISQATALPRCSGLGKTLFDVDGFAHHKVAQQYRRLAAEVEHRVAHRDAFLAGRLPPVPLPADVPADATPLAPEPLTLPG
jgi:chromosome partitioning protein